MSSGHCAKRSRCRKKPALLANRQQSGHKPILHTQRFSENICKTKNRVLRRLGFQMKSCKEHALKTGNMKEQILTSERSTVLNPRLVPVASAPEPEILEQR
jgi:hypothetical protein